MVSLQKNSYLPLDYVTSESKPFEAKGVAWFWKKALQFTTDYIASGADDCIYLLKLYKSEKKKLKKWRKCFEQNRDKK